MTNKIMTKGIETRITNAGLVTTKKSVAVKSEEFVEVMILFYEHYKTLAVEARLTQNDFIDVLFAGDKFPLDKDILEIQNPWFNNQKVEYAGSKLITPNETIWKNVKRLQLLIGNFVAKNGLTDKRWISWGNLYRVPEVKSIMDANIQAAFSGNNGPRAFLYSHGFYKASTWEVAAAAFELPIRILIQWVGSNKDSFEEVKGNKVGSGTFYKLTKKGVYGTTEIQNLNQYNGKLLTEKSLLEFGGFASPSKFLHNIAFKQIVGFENRARDAQEYTIKLFGGIYNECASLVGKAQIVELDWEQIKEPKSRFMQSFFEIKTCMTRRKKAAGVQGGTVKGNKSITMYKEKIKLNSF